MKKIAMLNLAGTACALLLAVPAAAQQPTPSPPAQTTPTQGTPATSAQATPAQVTPPQTTPAHSTPMRSAPETLSGKIAMVDPDRNLLVIDGPDNVPFDIMVTAKTQITSGSQALTMTDLAQHQNQNVSITFVPESSGDVAESIQVSS